MEIILKQSQASIKKPKHLKENDFILYSPRTVKIEPATSKRIDTEIIVSLPKNSIGLSHPYSEGTKLTNLTMSSNHCG